MSQLPGYTLPMDPPPFYPQPQPSTEDVEQITGADTAPAEPTVTVSDLGGITGELPSVVTDQLTANYYTESAIDGEYIVDEGLIQVPVAGPAGTQAEIIMVHAPVCKRVVKWTAERNGQLPKVPGSNTNNANEILGEKRVMPTSPGMRPSGQHIYRLSGLYEYLLLLPPGDNDPLSAGTASYDTTASSANNVTPAQFDNALLDSSSTVPAGFQPPPVN